MKKLYYIANVRLPTEKAHGIQIMEMCSAFAKEAMSVELIIPRRSNSIKEDPFDYYDIVRNFRIRRLPCLNTVRFGKIGYRIQSLSFAEIAAWFSFFKKDSIFYTRDEIIALYLRNMRKNVIWEGHTGQRNLIVKILIFLKVPFVVITEALRNLYVPFGVEPKRILVAADGADIDRFNIPMSKESARRQLELPLDKKIVLYKGHLYVRKGAHTLAEAAGYLGDDILCVFIGGTDEDVQSFRDRFGHLKNVLIKGNRPRQETPVYQKASDILVIPNSAKDDVSKLYSSPMKLFGYIASGVPIIASDLPSLREVLDESAAHFFESDNSKNLADAINEVLNKYDKAKAKADKALALAYQYSWQKRAEKILAYINKNES